MRIRSTRVLVVEDSSTMRRMIVETIGSFREFRVVAEATTGYEAIRLIHELNPDLVTLDLVMPDLGALETLGYIMSEAPRPVIILSGRGGRDAEEVIRALEYAAVAFVPKQTSSAAEALDAWQGRLRHALRAAVLAHLEGLPLRLPGQIARRVEARRRAAGPGPGPRPPAVLALAASTGGPSALADLVAERPANLP